MLTVLGLAVAAHGLGWLWLTGAITVSFSDWVAQQRARGWEVEHALPARGGWPFTARLTVPGIRIAGWTGGVPQGFVWEAERLDLAIAPPRLDRLMLAARGAQRITAGAVSVPYTAERVQAVVALDAGPLPRPAELTLEGLRAATPDGPLNAERIHARLAPGGAEGEPGLGLRVEARQVSLPPWPEVAAFGPDLALAALEAVLVGPPPPPLPMTPRERAEVWRANGTTLDLRAATLRWGPLVGELRMALRLDAALQPVGTGQLSVERPGEMVAALAAVGAIPARTAMTAAAVLGMIARVPEAGGAPRVEAPVGIEGGALTLAGIPMLRLRPIVWPGEAAHPR